MAAIAAILLFWITVGTRLSLPAWQSGFLPAALVGGILGRIWPRTSHSRWLVPILLGTFSGLMGEAVGRWRDLEAAQMAAMEHADRARMHTLLAAAAGGLPPGVDTTALVDPPSIADGSGENPERIGETIDSVTDTLPFRFSWRDSAFWRFVLDGWWTRPKPPLLAAASGVLGSLLAFHLASRPSVS